MPSLRHFPLGIPPGTMPSRGEPPRFSGSSYVSPSEPPRFGRSITPPGATSRGRMAVDVISLINMKGGVGKSTTTHNLAGALAKVGRRVLLVDNDPQSSLSQGLLGPATAEALEPAETVEAVDAGTATPAAGVRPAVVPGVDLVPGAIHTDRHNRPTPEEAPWPDQVALRDFLAELADGYDIALVDNPPNLHLCSWAALAASGWVLIPVQPEDYGAQGLAAVRRSVDRVRAAVNPG